MEQRARIPVTLPRDHPTTPFWQDPPDADVADRQSSAALPAAVDVVIVGSGITGASIAWHFFHDDDDDKDKDKQPSVLMLEARQAASGATGRNGGHTKAASYWAFPAHAAAHGTAAAVQIAQLELAGIRAVHGLAAAEAIPCDAHPCETVDVLYDGAKWARAQASIAALQAALPPGDPAAAYRLYDREAALATFPCRDGDGDNQTQKVCGAVTYEAGSIAAYSFTVGVLKRCLARGLQLHTHTPVLRLEKTDNDEHRWTVHTSRGSVAARHVVLATNAYTAFLVPALQGVVVPLRGQVAMHRADRTPTGGEGGGGPLPHTYSFVYAAGYDYMVTRPAGPRVRAAGAMVIGGGLACADNADDEYGTTDDTTLNPAVSAYLRAAPGRYFGGERVNTANTADVREWSGIMGYTPDGLPLVGAMPDAANAANAAHNTHLWLCCAFQGHGMVFSWLCGRAVAAMVRGRDGPALRQWFPDCFRVTADRLQQPFRERQHGVSDET